MEVIGAVLLKVLSGLISWGVVELNRYIRTKTKNEQISGAMEQIGHVVEATVQDLNQTVVKGMREAAADGKLTKNEAVGIKTKAVNQIKNQLPAAMQKTAGMAVNSLSGYINSRVEKAVSDIKIKQGPRE